MKGKKVLVRGNHDHIDDYRYQQLYEEICDYKEIQDGIDGKQYHLVLFHYPIFSWKNMGHGTILYMAIRTTAWRIRIIRSA